MPKKLDTTSILQEAPETHLNRVQQDYYLVQPNRTIAIIGRGGGKSFGIQSTFTAENALAMPRGMQQFGAYSYIGLLTNILPGVLAGWRELYGWQENIHYFIGDWAPKKWKWERPYYAPRGETKHLIHLYTGHALLLASMDRALHNGASIDAFGLDEARLTRRKKVAEMIPAMRGNLEVFGHLSNYGSILMTSDMPDLPHEQWLFDYESDHTPDLVDKIMAWQCLLHGEDGLLLRYTVAQGEYKRKIGQEIAQIQQRINELRKECTMFMTASSFENLLVLGRATIERWKASMTDAEFDRSVITKRKKRVLNGFYAALDPERDSYDGAFNYNYIDNLEGMHRGRVKRDARMDGDYNQELPLHIAFDHNAAINSLVIGQLRPNNRGDFINAMYTLQPNYLRQLLDDFIEYYRHTPDSKKRVVYWYDMTSIKSNSQGQMTEQEEVVQVLTKAGWKVTAKYLGRTDTHTEKYKMWNKVLMRTDPSLPVIRYNRVNCLQLEISMLGTGMRRSGDDYKKDKSTEDKDYKTGTYKVPPQNAPHFSEAADTLLRGWVANPSHGRGFSDPVIP